MVYRCLAAGAVGALLAVALAGAGPSVGLAPETGLRLLQLLGGAGMLAAGALMLVHPAHGVPRHLFGRPIRRPRLWGAASAAAGLGALAGGIVGGGVGVRVAAALVWVGLAVLAASVVWPPRATTGRR